GGRGRRARVGVAGGAVIFDRQVLRRSGGGGRQRAGEQRGEDGEREAERHRASPVRWASEPGDTPAPVDRPPLLCTQGRTGSSAGVHAAAAIAAMSMPITFSRLLSALKANVLTSSVW